MFGIDVQSTRGKILVTATEIMAEQGYEKTTQKQIAQRIGLSSTAIYYHFPTKKDILNELIRLLIDNLMNYRPSEQEMDRIIMDGTIMDVLDRLLYTFPKADVSVMIRLMRIFLMNCFTMPELTQLYQSHFVEGQRNYVESILKEMRLMKMIPPIDSCAIAGAISDAINFRAMLTCMMPNLMAFQEYHERYSYKDMMTFRATVCGWLTEGRYSQIGITMPVAVQQAFLRGVSH